MDLYTAPYPEAIFFLSRDIYLSLVELAQVQSSFNKRVSHLNETDSLFRVNSSSNILEGSKH